MLDDMGNWRKTHYTNEVSTELEDQEVILGGWVRNYRDLGGLKFLQLQDRSGVVQIVLPKKKVTPEIFEVDYQEGDILLIDYYGYKFTDNNNWGYIKSAKKTTLPF